MSDWTAPFPEPDWASKCGNAILYNRDCLEVLNALPYGQADAIVTDPPYSSGGQFRGDRMVDSRTKYVQTQSQHTLRAFSGDNRDQRSYLAWCSLWMMQATHVSKPGALLSVFADWRQLPTTTDAIQAAGWVWRGIAIWQKVNARPTLGRYTNQCEFIPWGTNGPRETEGKTARGWIIESAPPNATRKHITEKPVEVMKWLLEPVASQGVVVDPFAGSCTTGVACLHTGRRFVGVELNNEYFDDACTRLHVEHERLALLHQNTPQQAQLFTENASDE